MAQTSRPSSEELRAEGFLPLKESGARVNRSIAWVRTRIDDGRIGAVRIGKRVWVLVSDIDAQAGVKPETEGE